MNKIIGGAIAGAIIAIGISISLVDYTPSEFEIDKTTGFVGDPSQINEFQIEQENVLFLTAITAGIIPQTIEELSTYPEGFGYGWIGQTYVEETKHNFTLGYLANIHPVGGAPVNWHPEAVNLSPRNETEFCIDSVVTIVGDVTIAGNQIKVVATPHYAVKLDKVISYELVKDGSCHIGYVLKILDSKN